MADAVTSSYSPPTKRTGGFFRSSVGDPDISIDPGAPLQPGSDEGTSIFAIADSSGNTHVSGIAVTAGEAPGHVDVQYNGPITLTTAQWDARTGQSGGLTPKATYYLSPTAQGKLTTTKPNVGGQFIAPLGFALNATTLMIVISEPTQVP